MNKKLAAALSGGAVLVLALSGCSGDEADDGKKVEAWAKTFCDQAKPQIQKRADAQQTIISTAADGKPADVQAADSKAFRDIADTDKALAKAVESAGVPPVENGEKLRQDAIRELNATATAYEGLRKQVDALDPSDQQKFADGLQGVAKGLKRIEKMDQDALARLQSGELGRAMAEQPGCRKAKPSAAPTTTSGPAARPGTGSASPSPASPSAAVSGRASAAPSASAKPSAPAGPSASASAGSE
ncbi:small secreted protein [Streptomyces sp. MRC013]|uniref:small secreted protein n=1 Tax=Streptomyces sp. MRC013 TaxID=2898276 RepID=UPI00202608D5|nr:small secreted protein [Streptomyces sp. MRC013]URM90372.1 small secreted protein [Streptomyces sp. MRC013]